MDINKILSNPVSLKLDIMLRGIRVDRVLLDLLSKSNYIFTVEGIELELKNGIKVRAPYLDKISRRSPYMLDYESKEIVVDEQRVPVKLTGDFQINEKKTSNNILMSRIANLYGKYLAITPTPSCGFFGERLACAFCPAVEDEQKQGSPVSVEDVLETIREIYKTEKPSIILLSIGDMGTEDGGIEFAEQYIKAIHKYFNVMIMLEVSPPKYPEWIDTAYGAGADAICFNIDIFDQRLFNELCPGKAKDNGRERYFNALKYATGIYPQGTVLTHLILGIEPVESTIAGIQYLTSIGVVPILSVFRPVNKSMMEYFVNLSIEEILPVYTSLYCSMRKNRIPFTWTKHLGFAITPLEASIFNCRNDLKNKMALMLEGSTAIDSIRAGMLRIRRSLRVKEL